MPSLMHAPERHTGEAFPPVGASRFGHDFAQMNVFSAAPKKLQTKLTVSAAGDSYEQEADRVAERIMQMPESSIQRKCSSCETDEHLEREKMPEISLMRNGGASGPGGTINASAESAVQGLSGGHPLPASERAYFEPRFERSFENVRIHNGSTADMAAKALNARAFTQGQNIAFAHGEYQPGTIEGRRLLAHELTHTVQQGNTQVVRREEDESCGACRDDWETIVNDDHARAITMLDNTIAKISSYDGTTPADVKASLEKWFKASSNSFATWVNFNLRVVSLLAPLAGYQCQQSSCGMCNSPNRYGWSVWCIPLTDIRVCDPFYFSMSDRQRSMGLVHEWVHKYGCNFDFGYCSGAECPGGTTRSLFNADPWAKLVLDLG